MKKFFYFLFSSNKGFSIIESAVVLLVFATLSVSLMNLFKIASKNYEIQSIRSKEDMILNAMRNFYRENDRLPFPAVNNSGIEFSAKNKTSILVGLVPYKTLGLSYDEVCDSKGCILNYIVNGFDCCVQEEGSFTDLDIAKNLLSDGKLVLNSHGQEAEVYLALMPQNTQHKKIGGNILLNKNALTLAISKNGFICVIK